MHFLWEISSLENLAFSYIFSHSAKISAISAPKVFYALSESSLGVWSEKFLPQSFFLPAKNSFSTFLLSGRAANFLFSYQSYYCHNKAEYKYYRTYNDIYRIAFLRRFSLVLLKDLFPFGLSSSSGAGLRRLGWWALLFTELSSVFIMPT